MFDVPTLRLFAGIMLALWVGTAVFLLVSSARYARAKTFEKVAERQLPRGLRLAWPIVNLVSIPALFLAVLLPETITGTVLNLSFPGETLVQGIGLALFFAAGWLALVSVRHLGRHMRSEIVVAKDHELITTGPYARIRHPAYTAIILLSLSVTLLLLHLLLVLNWLIVVAIAGYRARREEELLSSEEGFGARYREYMGRTGRFLPRVLRSGSRPGE